MNDEYNKLLAKAVKATCGPSDLEQEAREVLDETGLTPRKIYNELVILKERYTNQVGITEMEIDQLKKALTKASQALQAYVNKFGHCGNVYEQAQKALAGKEDN